MNTDSFLFSNLLKNIYDGGGRGGFINVADYMKPGKEMPVESFLRLVALEHRRRNKNRKSHHAAGVVFEGRLVAYSINNGLDHAEVRAVRHFLATPLSWCVKRAKEKDSRGGGASGELKDASF